MFHLNFLRESDNVLNVLNNKPFKI